MPETLAQRLEEGIYQIVAVLPDLGLALGILLAGFAIAAMIERGTAAFLKRIGFDRWMEDGGVTEALERAGSPLEPSVVLAKLVFWTVMVLVILLAANALGLAVVSALFAELLAYIPNVIAAVIVLVLGLVLGEFVKNLVLASAGAVHGGPTLARAAKAAVIVLAVFMALEQIQIAQDIVLVAFMAVVGAAALAAGIAFGLGGRRVAAEITREWYEATRRRPTGAAHDAAARRAAFRSHPFVARLGESPPEATPSHPPASTGAESDEPDAAAGPDARSR